MLWINRCGVAWSARVSDACVHIGILQVVQTMARVSDSRMHERQLHAPATSTSASDPPSASDDLQV
eukprot:6596354-Alexandrium_andersonii.AAC.1